MQRSSWKNRIVSVLSGTGLFATMGRCLTETVCGNGGLRSIWALVSQKSGLRTAIRNTWGTRCTR